MPNGEEQQKQKNQRPSWLRYFIHNRLSMIWNPTLGKRFGMMTLITREGKPQEVIGIQKYLPLLKQNDGKVADVGEIESKWTVIEEYLFGPPDYKFEKTPKGEHACEQYRRIEYFRDRKLTLNEATAFKETGTIQLGELRVDIDVAKFEERARQIKTDLEAKQAAGTITGEELDILDKTNQFLTNPSAYIKSVSVLPSIRVNAMDSLFIDGRSEKIIAIGEANREKIINIFSTFSEGIDPFAAARGVGPEVRGPVGDLLKIVQSNLDTINKLEVQHGEKTSEIASILVDLHEKISLGTGVVEEKRPTKAWIRFAHTYKIIKPYRVEVRNVVKFKDEHPDFKRNDELEAGLDENGWPLEVDEDGNVLLDKWWVEISEKEWQEKIIKGKVGGNDVWRDKVTNGVKKANRYTHRYRSGYVRKVPAEYVGDVDPLDKISFISNETDAFRDDFRDGRFHPHSKSSMDYIIAGANNIIPETPINFKIDTGDPEVRIKFIPIYYTSADTNDKALWGTVNQNGGMGRITTAQIPEDERRVSRRYTMDTEFGTQENQIRKPTHLNPAFDRAALGHTFIHWGRMYYYETTEGINRWSENPFPHVSSRGFGKYLINLILLKSFSFNDARNTLKGHTWDYGVRHYGEPFIEDPLGHAEAPGGALWHAKEVARRGGGS